MDWAEKVQWIGLHVEELFRAAADRERFHDIIDLICINNKNKTCIHIC